MSKRPAGKSPESGPVRYRDRPADEGKFGDAADEPTPALPGAGERGGTDERGGVGQRGAGKRKPARRPKR
jgi:hypothetical protein